MWRQMLRVLPKNFKQICYKTTVQKVANRRRALLHSAFLMSTAQVVINNLPETPDELCTDGLDAPATDIDEIQVAADIEATYAESGEALGNLIQTLHACIQEICDQYQHCIAKQIEITMSCMSMDPVGPHWDEMTKYRVIADDLRVEFIKYRTLVSTIGSIVKNEKFKSNETNLPHAEVTKISEAYQTLVDMIEKRSKENSTWDLKLVDVHMKSILVTDATEE